MAYKFQTLAATMSGSLTQEGDFAVHDHSGAEKASIGIDGAVSGSGALSAGGNLRTAGTVRFDGVTQAAVAVSADSILFFDADDNLVKKEAVGDFAADLAGTGLEEDSDTIRIATSAAGDGLAGGGGSALSVAVSGAIHVSGDKVSLTGSLAGDCLDKGPNDGVDSIAQLNVVADESTIESAGLAALRIKDDGVTGAKLAPAVAGAGLAQDGSGNLDVGAATNGGIAVNANDIGLDLNDLSAASVNVANDSIAIVDADDSNGSKKESIADFVAAIAGSGLAASSGVLSTQAGAVAARADGETLTEGYNIFADLAADATVTLPSGTLGDVIVVKARNLTSGANIIVNPTGSQTIDGLSSIRLESPFGAVSLVYAQANDWRIV